MMFDERSSRRARQAMLVAAERQTLAQQAMRARREAFYASTRFMDIVDWLRAHPAGVDTQKMAADKNIYPFTAQEFSDFCAIMLLRHCKDARRLPNCDFPTSYVEAHGVRVTFARGTQLQISARASGPRLVP